MRGDVEGLHPDFYDLLEQMELELPFTLVITSGYREGDPRAHGQGVGVDVAAAGAWARLKIVSAALNAGIKRIGVYDRHIHLDVWDQYQEIHGAVPIGIWSGSSR